MILKAGDANKYCRNGKAYEEFSLAMHTIHVAVTAGLTSCKIGIDKMADSTVEKLAEWLFEKGYTVIKADSVLHVFWDNAT